MRLGHTIKFTQVALGLVPEVLDAVDVVFTSGKKLGVIDPQMPEARNIQRILAEYPTSRGRLRALVQNPCCPNLSTTVKRVEFLLLYPPCGTFPDVAKQNRMQIGTIKSPCFHRGFIAIKLVAGAGFEPTTFRL